METSKMVKSQKFSQDEETPFPSSYCCVVNLNRASLTLLVWHSISSCKQNIRGGMVNIINLWDRFIRMVKDIATHPLKCYFSIRWDVLQHIYATLLSRGAVSSILTYSAKKKKKKRSYSPFRISPFSEWYFYLQELDTMFSIFLIKRKLSLYLNRKGYSCLCVCMCG